MTNKKYIHIALLVIVIPYFLIGTGCVTAGILGVAAKKLSGASSAPTVQANLSGEAQNQLVHNEEKTVTTDKRKIKMSGDNANITDTDTAVTNNYRIPLGYLVLMNLGWFLPGPVECGRLFIRGLKSLFGVFKK